MPFLRSIKRLLKISESSMFFTRKIVLFCACLFCFSCSKRNYNVDAETTINQPEEKTRLGFLKKGDEVATADTAKPTLALVIDSSAIKDAQKKKKKPKKSKKEFLGQKIKRGYTKVGSGKNATIETFYYLPTYQEPSPYAPARYFFNTRRKRILRAGATINPREARILHGPYKRMIGRRVVMEGYFYVGTRHLRWETYRQNASKENILVSKIHYEKGFPRDAIVHYYDAAKTKIKEVIPYADGKLNGEYVMFRPDGTMAWQGQYENGKKVGVWIEYWDFRNRKHYEYQYPETADATPFEPYLLREYDRHSTLVYERGKLDKRPAQ